MSPYYRGKITIEQIEEGVRLTLRNARALAEEAQFLLDQGRPARALALSRSALEEVGKTHVLRAMARIPAANQKLWAEKWGEFRKHEVKTAHGRMNLLQDEDRRTVGHVLAATERELIEASAAESSRQAGMYVDFADDRWTSPEDTPLEPAQRALEAAEQAVRRLERIREYGLLSQKALAIEYEVLSPLYLDRPKGKALTKEYGEKVQGKVPEKMKEFYGRLVEEGVLSLDSEMHVMGLPLRQFLDEQS